MELLLLAIIFAMAIIAIIIIIVAAVTAATKQNTTNILKKDDNSDNYEKLEKINTALFELASVKRLAIILANFFLSHLSLYYILEHSLIAIEAHFKSYINEWTPFSLHMEIFNYDDIENSILFRDDIKQAMYAKLILESNEKFSQESSSWSLEEKKDLEDFEKLYRTLINQNEIVIKDSTLLGSYCYHIAFYFWAYICIRQLFINNANDIIETLHIDKSSSNEQIIEQLYTNGIETSDIALVLLLKDESNIEEISDENIEQFLHSNQLLIHIGDLAIEVNKTIENLKEKQEIEKLADINYSAKKYTIEDVDIMSGNQFEHFVSELFEAMGYKTYITPPSGDQGIDVIAKKGEAKVAIQAKCYSSAVGNHAIMEAVAGAKYYNANKIMVVTNNFFTKSAQDLAKSNNVTLWNRTALIEKIKELF